MKFLLKLFGFKVVKAKCSNCGYKWTAVYPVVREKYQICPKCGSKNWHEVKK